ncbi:MAG: M20/M25/M40 family metallo-hydrolase [Pseudomonadota bacterium]
MNGRGWLGSGILLAALTVSAHADFGSGVLLASYATLPPPWQCLEANSEQRMPFFVGAKPAEFILDGVSTENPVLPRRMKELGERQAAEVAKTIPHALPIEFEAWPAEDDLGRWTWAFARWRPDPNSSWKWLEGERPGNVEESDEETAIPPILPVTYRPADYNDRSAIFDDFLNYSDLYQKPVFGECVWTDAGGSQIYSAWNAPERARKWIGGVSVMQQVCRVIRQPSRFNERPITFVLGLSDSGLEWPEEIRWIEERKSETESLADVLRIRVWPKDLQATYEKMVRTLARGDSPRFVRKNSAQEKNQLLDVIGFLEGKYREMGIPTERQSFVWRNIPQANLIAMIQGTETDRFQNRPVLLADHIDTAFAEKVFEKKKHKRVSAPGADDNASATAALLSAAAVLRDQRPRHDIWLVHLTGEEFPADDLGAREFALKLLLDRTKIGGLIVLDMIGYNADSKDRPMFQINAGESPASVDIARRTLGAAVEVAPKMTPLFRLRFDPKSYLYNTDGIVFSDLGFPTLLLNEHINYWENLDRPHYHQTTDLPRTLDFDYAISITKVAIETVARLAETPVD